MKTTSKKAAANRANSLKSTGPKTDSGKARTSQNARKHGLLALAPVLPDLERRDAWEDHRDGVRASLAPVGYLEEVLVERLAGILWRLARVVRFETDAAALRLETVERDFLASLKEPDFGLLKPRTPDFPVMSVAQAEEDASVAQERLLFFRELEDLPVSAALNPDKAFSALCAVEDTMENEVPADIPGLPEDEDEREAFAGWTAGLFVTALDVYAQAEERSVESLVVAVVKDLEAARETAERNAKTNREELARRRRRLLLPKTEDMDKVSRYETTLERSFGKTLHELERLQARRSGAPVLPPMTLDVEVSRVDSEV